MFIILLTQLLCGFYNRKVSKNIIRGNRNLKEERALGERILFDRRISAGEQRAESSDIEKKKSQNRKEVMLPRAHRHQMEKEDRKDPSRVMRSLQVEGGSGWGRDECSKQEENETCSKWALQMPSLLLAHPQETYSKDPHTSSGSLRWMWFHSQKRRRFGPKNDWQ